MSRTDKGDLSTIMRDGEAKHFWRAMAETRAARLGEELDKLPKAKARGSNQHAEKEERFQFGTAPTLDHLGIDKKLSSRSQRRDVL